MVAECLHTTEQGSVCYACYGEVSSVLDRYREALESIAEMTDADAEFNAAQTAREALEEFDHGDHADRP